MGLQKKFSVKAATISNLAGDFTMSYPTMDLMFKYPNPAWTNATDQWTHGIFGSGGASQSWGYNGDTVTVTFGTLLPNGYQYDNSTGNIYTLRFIIRNPADKTKAGIFMFDDSDASTKSEYGYFPAKLKRAIEVDAAGEYDVAECYRILGGNNEDAIIEMTVDDPTAAPGTAEFTFKPLHSGVDNFDYGYSSQTYLVEAKLTTSITLSYSSSTGAYTATGSHTLDDGTNLTTKAGKNIYITNESTGDHGFFQYLGNVYGGIPSFRKVDVKGGEAIFFVKHSSTPTKYSRGGDLGGTVTEL